MDYDESRRGYEGKSKRPENTLPMQRASVVDRIWKTIENVREISSNVSVNKFLCEFIAEYFQDVAEILLGLGFNNDFVGGKIFDGGIDSEIDTTLVEKRSSDIAEAFEHRVGGGHEIPSDSKQLDSFLLRLLDVLQEGEDFVSFHKGLQKVNNAVVKRTGLHGEKFDRICVNLFIELRTYKLKRMFKPTDILLLRLFQQYLDSNCLGNTSHLHINFRILNVELATSLSRMLERPDCVPINTLELFYLFEPYLEASKCSLRIISALGRCMSVSKLRLVNSMNGSLWHELGCSLAANHSLKTLELCDVVFSLEGVAGVGEMLSKNSTPEELIIRCDSLVGERMAHLLWPLMTDKDGDPHVNTSLKRLEIHIGSVLFPSRNQRRSTIQYEHKEEAQVVARMLRTNKTLVNFRMRAPFSPDGVCEIVSSLKNNKALEMLDLGLSSKFYRAGDDVMVQKVLMDVPVKYNFTLKTIICGESQERIIESFINTTLEPTLRYSEEGWSVRGYSSEIPQWGIQHEVDFLKQGNKSLQLETSEGSNSAVLGYQEELKAEEDGCSLGFPRKHNIILSFYGEDKDFAQQLYEGFKSSHCRVFIIQDPDEDLTKVVEQCELAIVVFSKGYVTSERSMQELHTFMNFKNSNNQPLKVLPLFYKCGAYGHDLDLFLKLTPYDRDAYNMRKSFGDDIKSSERTQIVQRHNGVLWNNAFKFLLDAKNEEFTKTSSLINDFIGLRIEPKEFCNKFCEVVVRCWPCGGLDFENYGNSEVEYSRAAIEEVCIYMSMIDCNANEKLSQQAKLEKEYELSIRRMIPLWLKNAVFEKNSSLQRQVYTAQSWCAEELKSDAGRVTRALIGPTKFLYHFLATTLQVISKGEDHGDECISTLNDRAQQVTQSLFGGQIFKDDDFGASFGQIVAVCQIMKESGVDVITQYVITQDNLSGAYSVSSAELGAENALIDEAEGVIGVKVAPTNIHVENMWGDGSYCSGVLEDYSCALNPSNTQQCATKALGDLEGAGFLHKNRGIKCSPLLLIALVSAMRTKGLTLTWNNGKGYVEIDPIAARTRVSEAFECQILYTSEMKHLGEAVEWGMIQNASTSSNREIMQAESSNFAESAKYAAGAQDKKDWKLGVKFLGSGFDVGCQMQIAKGIILAGQSFLNLVKRSWKEKGGFEEIPDPKHNRIKEQLHQGTLPEATENYLVVLDDVKKSHVSIYAVGDENPEWITDILIDGGVEECDKIFKEYLKGRELTIKREGTNYAQIAHQNHSGFFAKLRNRIEKTRGKVVADCMTKVLELGSTSNNEWEHIVGRQEGYSDKSEFWWKASSMQAIICSRTKYSSGNELVTRIAPHENLDGKMGFCSRMCEPDDDPLKYVHLHTHTTSRGRFSKPPSSLLSNPMIYWGGCKELEEWQSVVFNNSDTEEENICEDGDDKSLQLETSEGSNSAVPGYQEELKAEEDGCSVGIPRKHNIILSFYGEEKDFAQQLYEGFKSSHCRLIIQGPDQDLTKVVEQCELAIVVLSKGYVTSKRTMLELHTFMNFKNSNNQPLKVLPLFYKWGPYGRDLDLFHKLTPYDLESKTGELGDIKSFELTEVVESHNIVSWDTALKFLLDAKNEEFTKTSSLISDLIGLTIEPKKFCSEFCKVVVPNWPCGGLDFKNYGNSEVEYSRATLEEVCIYMSVIDCNANDELSQQAKLEKEYELSIRRMIPLWLKNAVFEKNSSLQRQVYTAQSWCAEELKSDAGRITRAFIGPSKFLYHFLATTLQAISKGEDLGDDCISTWKERAQLVTQSLFGGQIFKDDDFGASFGQIVAVCQIMKESGVDVITQYVITQDNLSGAYSVSSAELGAENALIDEAEGVIGVKVAPTNIHVENMWGDGSYCSGVLEDYSYALNPSNTQQCATKALGDLEGAGFLHKNRGIKCSPLLLIALVSAMRTKGLTLTWNNGKGHVEIDPNAAGTRDSKACECQILFTSKMKQLGEAVEWGMTQNGSNSSNSREVMQAESAKFAAGAQDKKDWKLGIKFLGSGFDVGCQMQTAKGKILAGQAYQNLLNRYWKEKGGFKEIHVKKHKDIKEQLHQGTLPDAPQNYLVVLDDVNKSHVSIYEVGEDNPGWITDIVIDKGSELRDKIFKEYLKGRELTIKRKGANYAHNYAHQNHSGFLAIFNRNGKDVADYMTKVSELGSTSNEEWEHIVGRQKRYSDKSEFWWRASSMQAIICSRTKYSSGNTLVTWTGPHDNMVGEMGYCSRMCEPDDDSQKYVHLCPEVTSRGRFSKPPSSLQIPMIYWGGCNEHEGCQSVFNNSEEEEDIFFDAE